MELNFLIRDRISCVGAESAKCSEERERKKYAYEMCVYVYIGTAEVERKVLRRERAARKHIEMYFVQNVQKTHRDAQEIKRGKHKREKESG